jgi:hypothetical protein
MTLAEVVKRAYRFAGYLKLDDEPTPAEYDNALLTLQGLYYELLVQYARLTDVQVAAAYEAGENERVFNTTDAGVTITLPESIDDTTVTSGERPPKNGSIVEIAGATHQAHVYVAHFGAWKQLQGLASTDAQPLGPAYDTEVAALLAVRIHPEIVTDSGRLPALSPAVEMMARNGKTSIRQRFRQPTQAVTDPLLLSPRRRFFF